MTAIEYMMDLLTAKWLTKKLQNNLKENPKDMFGVSNRETRYHNIIISYLNLLFYAHQ